MSFVPPVGPATTTSRGTVKLAGDLGGTADAPTLNTGRVTSDKLSVVGSPTSGQVLSYNGTGFAWATASGAAPTSATSTLAGGSLTLTAGTSAQLTKLKSTLTSNLAVTLAGTTANTIFELSFIDTIFNGFVVTIGADSFTYPTYVKYVYTGGAWERVI